MELKYNFYVTKRHTVVSESGPDYVRGISWKMVVTSGDNRTELTDFITLPKPENLDGLVPANEITSEMLKEWAIDKMGGQEWIGMVLGSIAEDFERNDVLRFGEEHMIVDEA